MSGRLRLPLAVLCAAAFASVVLVAPAAPANPAGPVTSLTQAVNATVTSGAATLTNATLTPVRFVNQNGTLALVGELQGTLTDTVTGAVTTLDQLVTIPITQATGSCQILDLTLGPLDLNLLGLVVHLDTVHLNITAVPGAGNLLGNLLCAVTHLLDNGSALNGLVNQLNNILARL